MQVVQEEKSTFRKIGNSLGVIVPSSIWRDGGFSLNDEVNISCPRPGVITINSIQHSHTNKLQVLKDLQSFISIHRNSNASWPNDKNFKEILNEARAEKF